MKVRQLKHRRATRGSRGVWASLLMEANTLLRGLPGSLDEIGSCDKQIVRTGLPTPHWRRTA